VKETKKCGMMKMMILFDSNNNNKNKFLKIL
jgi:hypothetical protein